MSYTDDLSRALEFIRSEAESVAGKDLTVYFWGESDNDSAVELIVETDSEGNNVHDALGITSSTGILNPDPIKEEFKRVLSEYVELGVISSWEEVGSAVNESGSLADLTVGVSSLPSSGGGVLKGLTVSGRGVSTTEDNDSESVVFFDESVLSDNNRLREFFILHELGHAFGLMHTHNDEVSYSGTIYDNHKYSVMSYQGQRL